MVKVFGHSDDIVVVRIWFTDGTAILVSYDGCWNITVDTRGTAEQKLGLDFSKNFTDVFYIDADVKTHEVIDRR